MGEVYRARDARLNRDVALKVLPDLFASDPERLARFQREAQVLAALKHPNIGVIYGLEESPSTGPGLAPVRALVLELIEGETLAERIATHAGSTGAGLPVDEALSIATQIAEALQAAHEQGVIHRDLKPANIKITPEGTVKVLDFGLAKLAQADGAGGASAAGGTGGLAGLSMSPTITTPAATAMGVILGTAAYMAPEQAKGRPADKRSDVWAFGCVLYEMLTGKRPFEGEDVSDTLANVLKIDPDWGALPREVPPAVRALLRRCVEKDRRKRIADISTALFVLDEATSLAAAGEGPARAGHYVQDRVGRRIAIFTAAALVVGAAAAGTLVWLATRPTPSVPPRVERFTMAPLGTAALTINGNDRDLAMTPDGTRIVYAGNNGTQLFVRTLDQLDPAPLTTAGAVRAVFVAPDGQWVGFVDNNTFLKKVAITGGPAVTLAQMDAASRGTTWAPDDTIIFATSNATTGLQRVSAGGGTVSVLTRPDRARGEADHLWPEMLPGGRSVLFTITTSSGGGLDAAQIAVLDLASGTHQILLRGGSHAHYAPTGHLVYTAGGTLRAVGFDLDRLETRGTPVPVLPRLVTTAGGAADFVLATDGTLVYVDAPGAGSFATRTLVWVDRQGREQPVPAPPRAYVYPRLSPDGARVAVSSADQESDIWMWDLARQTLTRLTSDPGTDNYPVWTPDGRRLIFASQRAGGSNLYWQAADGTGAAERLTESGNQQQPSGVSPDGTRVVFHEVTPMMGNDLMLLTLDGALRPPSQGSGEPRPLLQTQFAERNGIVSPDGRWLAYESNSSGRYEIYVRPFPNVADGQWQVSTTGGVRPLWARNGQELFYMAPDSALMAVRTEARGTSWNAGPPAKLLEAGYFAAGGNAGRTYDISPDGQRFLMIEQGGADQTAAPPQIVVVKNWVEELKRLVPTN